MTTTRWAILGPGAIARDFAEGLSHSAKGELAAVASSSAERGAAFAAEFGAAVSGSYADVLARTDIDAVYVATVHTTHAELSIAALEEGKAVLCEKPASTSAAETARVLAAAERAGLPYVEAFKFRFSPFLRGLEAVLADGRLGDTLHLSASFGFASQTTEGRLFDPDLAGGAILDVGCYAVSFAVRVAHSMGIPLETLSLTDTVGDVSDSGVDTDASTRVDAGRLTADLRTSIVSNLPRSIRLSGDRATLVSDDGWGSRHKSAAGFTVGDHVSSFPAVDPFTAEADAVSDAISTGTLESPHMTWAETLTTARLLDAWRDGITRHR